MREVIAQLSKDGIHLFAAGGNLRVVGALDPDQREFIKDNRDDLLLALPVDAERYMKGLAVGLPVDHEWLMNLFFTPEDLTLLSLGKYLGGNLEPYRESIRQYLLIQRWSKR